MAAMESSLAPRGQGTSLANNSVYYSASSGGTNGVNCFVYPLALADNAFINNNHCHSAAAYEWVNGRVRLHHGRAMQRHTDSIQRPSLELTHVHRGRYELHPATGSPLIINAGNALYGSTLDYRQDTAIPPAIGAFQAMTGVAAPPLMSTKKIVTNEDLI